MVEARNFKFSAMIDRIYSESVKWSLSTPQKNIKKEKNFEGDLE